MSTWKMVGWILLITACLVFFRQAWRRAPRQGPRLVLYQHMERLGVEKEFLAATAGMSDRAMVAYADELSLKGLARLPAEELIRRAAVAVRLTQEAPVETCARWMSGAATYADQLALFRRLPTSERHTIEEIAGMAVVAELRDVGVPFRPAAADVEETWRRIEGALTPVEAGRYAVIRRARRGTSDTDICWLGRIIFEAGLRLADTDSGRALRVLAADAAQGERNR